MSGLTEGRIAPCYDPEKDTLYYVCNGELWAVPQFDAERIESVNDCQGTGETMFMLPGGFVLFQSYNSVEVKNTDPAQRGSIKLRIRDWGWSDALGEAIYDMNNTRGDISVIRQQDWNSQNDILQAMMNRDGSIDIYVMQYDGNEYSALRNREYLTDLSGNEKIAANVDRLYPYVRDAVKESYGKLSKIVSDTIAKEAAKIDGSQIMEEATEKAKEMLLQRFDGKLDGLMSDYQRNLDNVGKIYQSIASSMADKAGKDVTFKLG